MKILFLSSVCLMLSAICNINAQNLIMDDFESGQVSFTATVNVNPPTAGKFEVTNNPDNTGINTSAKCWMFTRLQADPEWAGFYCTPTQTISTNDYGYLHIKYYRTNANSKLRVMIKVNGDQKEFTSNPEPSKINTWENLVFDLNAAGVLKGNIEAFGFQPDFSTSRSVGTICYVDDIIFSASASGETGFASYVPKGLKIENVQLTSLDLSWSALQDAVSYDIYKNDVLLQNITGTSLNITNLDEYGVYKFHIVAKNAASELSQPSTGVYVQTPESKENRDTRMAWWREARFGMFIHWGGYAAYAGHFQGVDVHGNTVDYIADGGQNGSYAEWIMFGAAIPRDTYQAKIASDFTAENYDPKEWVRMAKAAGMKYIILTSKHHEGLSLFNTNIGWNVTDHSPAKKDLVKGLVDEARAAGLKIGFYYSQALDWNNPGGMGWMPQNNNGNGGEATENEKINYVENLVIPHLITLVDDYNIDVIWWDMGEPKYPELQYRTLKAIKDNPKAKNIISNDRLEFKIDNGFSGDFNTPEQSIPDVPVTGRADGRDWETCMTMNRNWGYASPDVDNQWKSSSDLILKLIDIASKGGNFLLNIGPKPDGTFPQESIDRLTDVGAWMSVNSEAIYGSIANPIDKAMDWGKITRKIDSEGNTTLYLHVAQWPSNSELVVPQLNSLPVSASILGNSTSITTESGNNKMIIKGLPVSPVSAVSTTIKLVFEGEPVLGENTVMPDANDKLTLLPADSKYDSEICVDNNTPQNFGCWDNGPIDSKKGLVPGTITWKIQINKPGNYVVSSDLEATAMSTLHLKIGDSTTDLNCAKASYGVQNNLAIISLAAGIYDVTLTRTSLEDNWNYVNLRNIVLSYASGTGIDDAVLSNVKVYGENGVLRIEGLEKGNNIRIYDVMGRLLVSKIAESSIEVFPLSYKSIIIAKISDKANESQIVRKVIIN